MRKITKSALKLGVCSLAMMGALTWTGSADRALPDSVFGLSSVAFADTAPLTLTQQAAMQAPSSGHQQCRSGSDRRCQDGSDPDGYRKRHPDVRSPPMVPVPLPPW